MRIKKYASIIVLKNKVGINMAAIFHVIRKCELDLLLEDYYKPKSLTVDGFIHCSKAEQLEEVLNRLLKNEKKLTIIKINVEKTKPEIKFESPIEAPHSKIYYPHIYGPLNNDAIEKKVELTIGDDGKFNLPKKLIS